MLDSYRDFRNYFRYYCVDTNSINFLGIREWSFLAVIVKILIKNYYYFRKVGRLCVRVARPSLPSFVSLGFLFTQLIKFCYQSVLAKSCYQSVNHTMFPGSSSSFFIETSFPLRVYVLERTIESELRYQLQSDGINIKLPFSIIVKLLLEWSCGGATIAYFDGWCLC